jgi:transcriptional regulator with XRE-family HTH domain
MTNYKETITMETPEIFYLSKEEISKLTGVSVHTFQNWVNDNKPTNEKDVKILKGGKKTYSITYLNEVLKKVDREELLVNLMIHQDNDSVDQWLGFDQPVVKYEEQSKVQESKNEEERHSQLVADHVNSAIVEGKNEVIQALKEQLELLTTQIQRKDEQIQNKDEQLAGLGQVLLQEQGLHFEARKDLKLAQEQNKLLLEQKEESQSQQIKPESSAQTQVDLMIPPKKKFLGIF